MGRIVTLEISDIGSEGQGVGRVDGLAVFVSGALPGDVVRAELIKEKKNYAVGSLVEIVQRSESRRQPECKEAACCGGCPLMALTYEAQTAFKERSVREKLTRLAGLEDPLIRPIIQADVREQYRNKAEYAVELRKNGAVAVGFRSAGSHQIVDCRGCRIQSPAAVAAAEALRGLGAHLAGIGGMIVKTAAGTGEVMILLEGRAQEPARGREKTTGRKTRSAAGKSAGAEVGRTVSGGNPTAVNGYGYREADMEQIAAALDEAVWNVGNSLESLWFLAPAAGERKAKQIKVAGKNTITDRLCGMEFEISPLAFYQVNPSQTEKLYAKVLEYADLQGGETVFDLYCGVGTIGLIAAAHMNKRNGSGKVIGVESVHGAVLDANRNAVINGIVNAVYYTGKAEDVIDRLLAGEADDSIQAEDSTEAQQGNAPTDLLLPDVVILDPPRAGCDRHLLEKAAQAGAQRIVYVSCDPATLARDIRILTELGYQFIEATPVDMFVQTAHVECVCLMTRTKG